MKTRKQIFREPLAVRGDEEWFLVGEITYNRGDLGGRRGYRLHIAPEGEQKRDGAAFTSHIFQVGMGASAFLREATRFNAKELERLEVPQEILVPLKAKVLLQWQDEEAKRVAYPQQMGTVRTTH